MWANMVRTLFTSCSVYEEGSACDVCGSKNTRVYGSVKECLDCKARCDMFSMHNRVDRDSWRDRR